MGFLHTATATLLSTWCPDLRRSPEKPWFCIYALGTDFSYKADMLPSSKTLRGSCNISRRPSPKAADLAFAAGHPEKIVDWGYRAVYIMKFAKLMIREYSGQVSEALVFDGLLD
jgi:hypothetical protein